MSAAAELLRHLSEIGASIHPAGDKLIVRAGTSPVPAELVRRLRAERADVLAALTRTTPAFDAAWWRRQFTVRTLDRLLGHRTLGEAKRLAFNHLVLEWHRLRGERPDCRRCAGCGDDLPDGTGIIVD